MSVELSIIILIAVTLLIVALIFKLLKGVIKTIVFIAFIFIVVSVTGVSVNSIITKAKETISFKDNEVILVIDSKEVTINKEMIKFIDIIKDKSNDKYYLTVLTKSSENFEIEVNKYVAYAIDLMVD